MQSIALKFMKEKKEGAGEDSPSLFFESKDFVSTGVFDGMGGAGSKPCKDDDGKIHSMAYIASRITENAIENYLADIQAPVQISSSSLKAIVVNRFKQEKEKHPPEGSSIRSKLIRDYPTTMALSLAYLDANSKYTIQSFWAGDSRNYLWTADGFAQISQDDLVGELDPLENLCKGARMSNCLCADRDFDIHEKKIENVCVPFILFSTTDGCFDCFPSPMHFQKMLQNTLSESSDSEEWCKKIEYAITNIASDDISLSLVAVGFENFESLKKILSKQNEILQELPDSTLECKKIWERYKIGYMRYLDGRTEIVKNKNKENQKIISKDARNDVRKPLVRKKSLPPKAYYNFKRYFLIWEKSIIRFIKRFLIIGNLFKQK